MLSRFSKDLSGAVLLFQRHSEFDILRCSNVLQAAHSTAGEWPGKYGKVKRIQLQQCTAHCSLFQSCFLLQQLQHDVQLQHGFKSTV